MVWVSPDKIYGPDIHEANLYEAVGIALSTWEDAELQIAILYSVLKGVRGGVDLVADFGLAGRTFKDRMCLLSKALEAFEIKVQNQNTESFATALVTEIIAEATALSTKRHQLAHGVIASALDLELTVPEPFSQFHPPTFAVVPPWYSVRRLARREPEKSYTYFTRHIEALVRQFEALGQRAHSANVRLAKLAFPKPSKKQGLEEFLLPSRWPQAALSQSQTGQDGSE